MCPSTTPSCSTPEPRRSITPQLQLLSLSVYHVLTTTFQQRQTLINKPWFTDLVSETLVCRVFQKLSGYNVSDLCFSSSHLYLLHTLIKQPAMLSGSSSKKGIPIRYLTFTAFQCLMAEQTFLLWTTRVEWRHKRWIVVSRPDWAPLRRSFIRAKGGSFITAGTTVSKQTQPWRSTHFTNHSYNSLTC